MKEIKINFTDFWPGFDKTNNYFYNLLVQNYRVLIDEQPDILFYSCFNHDYLNYNCTRIFYTPENIRPDFTACDFAFSFDYSSRQNHFRLPLYSFYVELLGLLPKLTSIPTRDEARSIWRGKTEFCCMVVSNPNSAKRLDFFRNLSKVKRVASGGAVLNNVGGKVPDKAAFIKDYKFVISFENSSYDGYTTEKIMEPIYEDCIPIYWGNPLVSKDFNSARFLEYNSFQNEEELIARLLEIDQNEELAIDILMQPTFSVDKVAHEQEKEQVLDIISNMIENPKKPIAQQWWRYLHHCKLLYRKNKKRLLVKFKLL
ncbi:glycosyltransferase family 10 domain-containing protein [Flavobacterium nackdongense]|uniref:Glycosyltransferase n=1 Tax=Flavobacterium nackdongense TaxID=2547394 RepID=A0A4P6YA04_9FLAO|nr:glycosyltransferase family 10 [Flavobacterium nackdongense]QBN19859.1 glycosyltransferase [Flavobacterium nackdongense]